MMVDGVLIMGTQPLVGTGAVHWHSFKWLFIQQWKYCSIFWFTTEHLWEADVVSAGWFTCCYVKGKIHAGMCSITCIVYMPLRENRYLWQPSSITFKPSVTADIWSGWRHHKKTKNTISSVSSGSSDGYTDEAIVDLKMERQSRRLIYCHWRRWELLFSIALSSPGMQKAVCLSVCLSVWIDLYKGLILSGSQSRYL